MTGEIIQTGHCVRCNKLRPWFPPAPIQPEYPNLARGYKCAACGLFRMHPGDEF